MYKVYRKFIYGVLGVIFLGWVITPGVNSTRSSEGIKNKGTMCSALKDCRTFESPTTAKR